MLDLYQRRGEGEPLGEGDSVVCADEKTSIQARVRKHPTASPAPGRVMRVEHEYERGGALAYLSAWDVHRARLFGRCEPRNGIEPFGRLVAQIMSVEPYVSAERIFWIVDNGTSHRGQASFDRLRSAFSKLVLVHLPVHAPGSTRSRSTSRSSSATYSLPTTSPTSPRLRLLAFQDHYERVARPFEWEFTRTDPDTLLAKVHQQHTPFTTAPA